MSVLVLWLAFLTPRLDVAPGGGCKCDGAGVPVSAIAPVLLAAALVTRRRR